MIGSISEQRSFKRESLMSAAHFLQDSHELCLQDFEHLDHRDLTCISRALVMRGAVGAVAPTDL